MAESLAKQPCDDKLDDNLSNKNKSSSSSNYGIRYNDTARELTYSYSHQCLLFNCFVLHSDLEHFIIIILNANKKSKIYTELKSILTYCD